MIVTIKIPSRNKPRRGEINTTLSGLDWNGLFTGYNHCTPSGLGYGSVDFYNHCTLSGLGWNWLFTGYNHCTPSGLGWNWLFTGYNHCTPSGLGYGSVDFYNHYTPLGFKLI